jgi:AraC-like DNA-binding protein
LASLPVLLDELGFDPQPIFKETGMTARRFANPDMTVPYVRASRLLAHCVAATGCEHLGLLLGERAGPSSLGIAGFMLGSAPDVGTALHALVDNLDLHDQGGVPMLHTNGSVTLLGYAVREIHAEAAEQIYDISIAVACNIMRSLCGADWNPIEVLLSRRRPRDLAPYRRFFRSPIRFDAEQSAVAFPTRWLGFRLKAADPLLHRHLYEEALRIRKRQASSSLSGKLFPALRSLLLAQSCSLSEAGRMLGLHPRTLNRRLRSEGTTYRREVEGAKYGTARHLLAKTSMPIAEIAAALDYADASAFIRAFIRWSGDSPGNWRNGGVKGHETPKGKAVSHFPIGTPTTWLHRTDQK